MKGFNLLWVVIVTAKFPQTGSVGNLKYLLTVLNQDAKTISDQKTILILHIEFLWVMYTKFENFMKIKICRDITEDDYDTKLEFREQTIELIITYI